MFTHKTCDRPVRSPQATNKRSHLPMREFNNWEEAAESVVSHHLFTFVWCLQPGKSLAARRYI